MLKKQKSLVLFIVEGESDRKTFETSIPSIYEKIDGNINVEFATIDEDAKKEHLKKYYGKRKEKKNIEINKDKIEKIDNEMSGGDITVIQGINKYNIEEKIYELIVHNFFKKTGYMKRHLSEIIQITDLDGVYIPDSAVIENSDSEKFIYTDNGIVCNSIDRALYRNRRKRDVINKLLSISSIKIQSKTVKYSIYFFSSNLDHFIHNNANLPHVDKTRKADEFSRKSPLEGINYLFNKICDDKDALQNMTYKESWDYITNRESMESIRRHTNLNVLLNNLKGQMKEDSTTDL